jgi:hypothetical protein
MPLASPPPPTGTSTQATSGRSATISRPTVPCPAITSWWSNGGTIVMPRSAAISAHRFSRSGGATSSISAPSARVASILTGDDTSGITITQGMPNARAVNASACAWLPGRVRHHAVGPHVGRDRRHGVVGAAQLERADRLQALRLQPQVAAGPGRGQHGGAHRDAVDVAGRRLHVREGHQLHVRERMAPPAAGGDVAVQALEIGRGEPLPRRTGTE